jgi:2-dehydropantoate 2-reductase
MVAGLNLSPSGAIISPAVSRKESTMRILVVGAGAIGGYFGGRLLEAKQDVTFLVRPRRAAELAASGLEIRSRNGDVTIPHPPTVLTEDLHSTVDLILLSCKAYDLDSAIAALAPAVGPETVILPLLNGMRHLDLLDQRFGPSRILGGLCIISTTLDPGGRVVHLNNVDQLVFGERRAPATGAASVAAYPPASTLVQCDSAPSPRAEAIAAFLSRAHFQSRLSQSILQEMWEKWVFIAACAGVTCLMRAPIGDIVASGAAPLALALFDECAAIASSQGYPPRPEPVQQSRAALTRAGSPLVASMFRDIERHAPVEVEHLIGNLRHRGEARSIPTPMLRVVYDHLKAYEARRLREASAQK